MGAEQDRNGDDGPVLVAHRAGNHLATARQALGRADVVELDVHVFRGRVEVRHGKVIWPTAVLWERWYLLPRDTAVPELREILDVLPDGTPLLLDLKCFTGRAARLIRRQVPDGYPVYASSRSWWVLRAFRHRPDTVALRSCGSRWQRFLVTWLPGLGDRCGAVVHERLLDRATIDRIRARTPVLFTWALPSVERAEALIADGVSGLIVDDLDLDWPAGSWFSERER